MPNGQPYVGNALAGNGVRPNRGDQIIGGKTYTPYTPEWYAAQKANEISTAGTAGTAIGTGAKNALDALGNITGSSSSSDATLGGGADSGIPRIGGAGGGGLPGYGTFDGGGGGGGAPTAPHAQIDQGKADAADAAIFGKAKDQVGQTSAGALSGLRSAMASRGMLGGQGEYRGTTSVANAGQQQLGDVTRQNAITDAGNQLDISKANLGADVTQRGQDISSSDTRRGQNMDYTLGGRGQDITQRGQDIQYKESQAQLALTKSLQEAAQRQSILQGIAGSISGPTLY